MVDSIHTGQQILDLNEKYPWTKCIKWPYTENYYNDDYSKKSIKYSPNTYKLYPTGMTGPHGRIYMALNSNLEITDEVIREHSLIIIRSFSVKLTKVMMTKVMMTKVMMTTAIILIVTFVSIAGNRELMTQIVLNVEKNIV